jgi:hypothetical protein
MKKILLTSVLAISLATTGLVYAQGRGGNGYGGGPRGGGGYGMMGGGYGGMGPGMMDGFGGNGGYYNCPGTAGFGPNGQQNNWNSENYQKFLNDTVQLRREMNNKRFEYQEALRDPKTTRAQLATLDKTMIDLRYKLAEKIDQYRQSPQVK